MSKIKNLQLIWNIISWIDHFNGKAKLLSVISDEKEKGCAIESENSSIYFNLANRSELLATDCLLTWWANMGVDNNKNENGEDIFDFDLTKKKNRDKFVA